MRITTLCFIAALLLPAPLAAQQLLERYSAFLSAQDHYNSKGVRLTQSWQIIRQDRANYHRFKIRDPADEWDSFFSSLQNRAIAEQMLINGHIDRNTARYIVNNETMIEVEIWGHGSKGTSINVTAY